MASSGSLSTAGRVTAGICGIACGIAAWWGAALWLAQPALLPSPPGVLRRFSADVMTSQLWDAIYTTGLEAASGCALAIAIAWPIAYVVYKSEILAAASSPIIAISQAIPSIALAPLIIVWLGYGLRAIAVLCALMVFFPMLITTVLGFRSLPREIKDAARLDGAEGWSLLRDIEAPMALPSILAGLRTGCTLSIIGAMVGEFIMGGRGLGARLTLQATAVDMAGLFSTITVMCALTALIFLTINLIERHSATMQSLQ